LGTGENKTDPNYIAGQQADITQAAVGQHNVVANENTQLGNIQARQAPTAQAAHDLYTQQGQAVNATAANINNTNQTQDRGQQQNLNAQLALQAQGGGPSVATDTLKQGEQANIANQMAMLASQRGQGGNAALGLRGAQDAAASGSQQVAGAAATARDQEQLNAQGQLAGNLSGMSAQDQTNAAAQAGLQQQVALQNASLGTGVNTTNAGAANAVNAQNASLAQQTALANQAATLQQQAETDQASLGLDNSQLNAAQGDTQAAEAAAQLGQAYSSQNQQGQEAASSARSGMAGGLLGGAASAIGSVASSSDEEEKTDIAPAGGSMINNYLNSTPGGAPSSTFGTSSNAPVKPKEGGGDMFSPATYASDPKDASGEAALAARDAHTANFAQMGQGQGDWFNISMAQPWSPESKAAWANENKYSFSSDENEKENIADADTKALHDFLGKLNAHSYEYKDPNKPGRAPGKQISPMAQEFLQSDIGKELVVKMPDDSLGVKYADPHALGALFAAQADAHKRLTALEKGKSKGKKK
jgi:hypothetical protein